MWRDVGPFLVGWACGWVLCWRRLPLLGAPGGARALTPPATAAGARTSDASAGARRPRAAVVVPARDEALVLPALLASLAVQLREDDQLVVVDDGSVDDTAAVARTGGARVVTAPTLPPGWTGKAWACATGAAATTAPVLVFLDADVTLAPGALDLVVTAAAARPDGLVTVQPWHDMRRPYEQLSVPCNLVALAGAGLTVPWGRRVRIRVAYGPVLATTRTAYESAGGHAHSDVRGSIVDDVALAQRYDGRVTVAHGRSLATFRMYPAGVRQLVEGWTKNMAAGASNAPWWAVALTVGWVWSMIGAPAAGWWCWLASAAQVLILGRRVGAVRWWAALLAPALAVWFLAVLAVSTWRRVRRRSVRWRGRDVRPA